VKRSIGVMQGRLSEPVDGKIQAFPWRDWRSEFSIAESIGLKLIEWTLDYDRLYSNPLMITEGQLEINALKKKFSVTVPSLTGDCFMQKPFWKVEDQAVKNSLEKDFLAVIRACSKVGINMVVVPLVDNGRLETRFQEDELIEFLKTHIYSLRENNIQLAFESDFEPVELRRMIDRLPDCCFGINYDIGNSASLGYDPVEEFIEYGSRILNIHVKDRLLNGITVPLGKGAAQLENVFSQISGIGYGGSLILQTARAEDKDHVSAICKYIDIVDNFLKKYSE
jgi:L-ribulose-5-phosphate 3-epimerase